MYLNNGNNNQIIFKLIDGTIVNYETKILDNLDIKLSGNNNRLIFTLYDDESIENFVLNKHIEIKLNGDNNIIDLGSFTTAYEPHKGIIGLEILVGGAADEKVYNTLIKAGNNNAYTGLSLHVKENCSKIIIGNDCIFSWIVYAWCTDGHAIISKNNEVINRGYSIYIGNHVWIGKDVKICKNTYIDDNSIVGWNSVITKKFNKKNVMIAGNPAKIVKDNVNWDRKCVSNYEKNI